MPSSEQLNALTTDFLFTAYDIAWNGQGPPPFTTEQAAYTIAHPINPLNGTDTTWTYPATRYFAALDCQPGSPGNFGVEPSFSDGNGCHIDKTVFEISLDTYFAHKIGLIGRQGPEENSISLFLQGNCTVAERSKLGLGWAQCSPPSAFDGCPTDGSSPATVLFCTTSYKAQNVTLTTSDRGEVVGVEDIEPSQDLQDFNATLFENILFTFQEHGQIPDMPPTSRSRDIYHPAGLAGYGMVFGSTEDGSLLNHTNLKNSFEAGYQLVFSMAVNSLLSKTENFISVRGNVATVQEGAIIIEAFAILLICTLTMIFFLGLVLLLQNWQRRSNLWSDPSSITHTMSLVSESTQVLRLLQSQAVCSWSNKEAIISLQKWSQGAPYRLDVLTFQKTSRKSKAKRIITATSPVERSILFSCGFLLFVIALLAFGAYLWHHDLQVQGRRSYIYPVAES